jgi:hypothetical protein
MAAALLLAAELIARLACVFAFPRPMASPLAAVKTALQFLATELAASYIRQPARLVLQPILAAHAVLGREKRTFWAILAVQVAVVGHLRVAAYLGPPAFEHARGRLRAARQRGLQNRLSAVATDLVEHCFATRVAKSSMAQFLALVVAAFEQPFADSSADMLRLVVV